MKVGVKNKRERETMRDSENKRERQTDMRKIETMRDTDR